MDLDLQTELRLNLKRKPLPARVTLDDVGFWLVIETTRSTVRIGLPDVMEESILNAIPR